MRMRKKEMEKFLIILNLGYQTREGKKLPWLRHPPQIRKNFCKEKESVSKSILFGSGSNLVILAIKKWIFSFWQLLKRREEFWG